MTSSSALGYNGKAVDIASLVSYLASKEAHFITGQSVSLKLIKCIEAKDEIYFAGVVQRRVIL